MGKVVETDEQLMAQVAQSGREALGILLRRYANPLLTFIRRMIGDRHRSCGGFGWFGHRPANRVLSAYGLMEFTDMARVHDVDPALIRRTRDWLLKQRNRDGSWDPEGHLLHEDPTGGSGQLARLGTTAYIAWAVYGTSRSAATEPDAATTLNWLVGHEAAAISDPYVLALVANAVGAIDGWGKAARPYLDRIETLKKTSSDGKLAWWETDRSGRTLFYGGGVSGQTEATALSVM